jgi:hypothetical protein
MKIKDLVFGDSDKKPVKGFSVVINQVGKKYNYNNNGFVINGARVLKGEKLPLSTYVITNSKSEDIGELYARR